MIQLTLWSVPPLLTAVICLFTLRETFRHRDLPGIHAIHWMTVAGLVWCLGQLAQSLLTEPSWKMLAHQVQYVGVAFVPMAWFCFSLSYARQQRDVTPRTLILTGIPAITFAGLALTNGWHGLFWISVVSVDAGSHIGLLPTAGPALAISAVWGLGLVFAGTAIIAFVLTSSVRYHRPLNALIAAPVITVLLHAFYYSPWNPWPWFDATPLGFVISSLMIRRALMRQGYTDIIPVIRQQVIEKLDDAVIILNRRGRIIDVNPAAIALLSPERSDILKRRAADVIEASTVELLLSGRDSHAELTVGTRAFHVRSTPLHGHTDGSARTALVFHDITERRDAELQLRAVQSKLQRLAYADCLTKLPNRRYFLRRLRQQGEHLKRYGGSISVLLLDLDHFKEINDTHGHAVGDRVLASVGKVLKQLRRATDVSARIGGEEFAVLLPETSGWGALNLAERVRLGIAKVSIADADGHPIQITASVGVATMSQVNSSSDWVLKQADDALYRAKQAGRNMVFCADSNPAAIAAAQQDAAPALGA